MGELKHDKRRGVDGIKDFVDDYLARDPQILPVDRNDFG